MPRGQLTFTGNISGIPDAFAAFMLGLPYTAQSAEGQPPLTTLQQRLGLYWTDDFKATSRLTLNIGVRWDWFGHVHDLDNLGRIRSVSFAPGQAQTINGQFVPELIPNPGRRDLDPNGDRWPPEDHPPRPDLHDRRRTSEKHRGVFPRSRRASSSLGGFGIRIDGAGCSFWNLGENAFSRKTSAQRSVSLRFFHGSMGVPCIPRVSVVNRSSSVGKRRGRRGTELVDTVNEARGRNPEARRGCAFAISTLTVATGAAVGIERDSQGT